MKFLFWQDSDESFLVTAYASALWAGGRIFRRNSRVGPACLESRSAWVPSLGGRRNLWKDLKSVFERFRPLWQRITRVIGSFQTEVNNAFYSPSTETDSSCSFQSADSTPLYSYQCCHVPDILHVNGSDDSPHLESPGFTNHSEFVPAIENSRYRASNTRHLDRSTSFRLRVRRLSYCRRVSKVFSNVRFRSCRTLEHTSTLRNYQKLDVEQELTVKEFANNQLRIAAESDWNYTLSDDISSASCNAISLPLVAERSCVVAVEGISDSFECISDTTKLPKDRENADVRRTGLNQSVTIIGTAGPSGENKRRNYGKSSRRRGRKKRTKAQPGSGLMSIHKPKYSASEQHAALPHYATRLQERLLLQKARTCAISRAHVSRQSPVLTRAMKRKKTPSASRLAIKHKLSASSLKTKPPKRAKRVRMRHF